VSVPVRYHSRVIRLASMVQAFIAAHADEAILRWPPQGVTLVMCSRMTLAARPGDERACAAPLAFDRDAR
jgi:hypothetical protein